MEGFDQGVTSDSPTGTEVEQNGASSAGTLNTEPTAPRTQPTVPYERFHEVNTGYRQAEARAAAAEQAALLHQQQLQQATQRLQALESQLQAQVNQVPRTPQEAQERQAAMKALRELQSDDPEHRQLQQLAKAAPALAQAVIDAREQIAGLQQATALNFARSEEGRLYQLATAQGMTFATAQDFAEFNDHVASIIARSPQALQAFQRGDTRVLPEALKLAKQQVDAYAQRARASLAQTKTATRNLPPRIGGSAPGSPPIPKFDPKDPRGSMAKIHAGAEADLMARLG